MERRHERSARFEILVKMRDVGGDNHPATAGVNAHELQAGGMPAGRMQ